MKMLNAALRATVVLASVSPAAGQTGAETHVARYRGGAVAADHAAASMAGAAMLAKGGNAVDAAVATSFALSVVRPFSCGVGGGGFMVIHLNDHPKHGTIDIALNYREQAPACMTPEYYERLAKDKPELGKPSVRGGTAVAIPGTVAGLLAALETYGTLDRATVLAPAIRAAEEGFLADDAYMQAISQEIAPAFRQEPELQTRFGFVWGRFAKGGEVKIGDRITLPEQAALFREVAARGVDGFREGVVGRAIVDAITRDGGEMTAADLKAHTVQTLTPLTASWMGLRVVTMPPPSSGGVVLAQVFGTLAADAARLREAGLNSPAYVHLVTEAGKHAFADRARWLADPAFVKLPMEQLLDPAMLARRGASINPDGVGAAESYGWSGRPAAPLPEDHGTSHLSVVDAKGNAVACTETINLTFGSWLAVDRFGFCLNNEMDDFLTTKGKPNAFGLTQADANLPEPGKRPLSSMTPTILLEDVPAGARVRAVAGGSGGPRIISGTLEVLLAYTVFGLEAGRAVEAPRFHHQWMPNVLQVESAMVADDLIRGISSRGHDVQRKEPGWGVAAIQVITVSGSGEIVAASDPRKGGKPAGLGMVK